MSKLTATSYITISSSSAEMTITPDIFLIPTDSEGKTLSAGSQEILVSFTSGTWNISTDKGTVSGNKITYSWALGAQISRSDIKITAKNSKNTSEEIIKYVTFDANKQGIQGEQGIQGDQGKDGDSSRNLLYNSGFFKTHNELKVSNKNNEIWHLIDDITKDDIIIKDVETLHYSALKVESGKTIGQGLKYENSTFSNMDIANKLKMDRVESGNYYFSFDSTGNRENIILTFKSSTNNDISCTFYKNEPIESKNNINWVRHYYILEITSEVALNNILIFTLKNDSLSTLYIKNFKLEKIDDNEEPSAWSVNSHDIVGSSFIEKTTYWDVLENSIDGYVGEQSLSSDGFIEKLFSSLKMTKDMIEFAVVDEKEASATESKFALTADAINMCSGDINFEAANSINFRIGENKNNPTLNDILSIDVNGLHISNGDNGNEVAIDSNSIYVGLKNREETGKDYIVGYSEFKKTDLRSGYLMISTDSNHGTIFSSVAPDFSGLISKDDGEVDDGLISKDDGAVEVKRGEDIFGGF